MTPLEVAQGMANFLKERLAEYEERGGKRVPCLCGLPAACSSCGRTGKAVPCYCDTPRSDNR